MISHRKAAVAAASLLSAFIVVPTVTFADDKPPQGDSATEKDNKKRGRDGGERRAPREDGRSGGGGGAGWQGKDPRENKRGGDRQAQEPRENKRGGGQQESKPQGQSEQQPRPQPNKPAFAPGRNEDGNRPSFTKQPKQQESPPVINAAPKETVPPNTFSKDRAQDQPKTGDHGQRDGKRFGDRRPDSNPGAAPNDVSPAGDRAGNRPDAGPNGRPRPSVGGFGGAADRARNLPKPPSAADARVRFENLRKQRTEKTIAGGGVMIKEPGNRTIFKQNNRFVIQHDETERLRRVAPNARFEKGRSGTNIAVIDRPGNMKIYSETDADGRLLRRYRRGPDGRDVIIIDNRRRDRRGVRGRDIAAGVGIGIGVVAGAAILNSVLDVPPPRVRIPRDQYIVEYEGASDEAVYDALSAPPVDEFSDRYTLDEIRATATLRDRMRRIDLDDINFEFGSWEVDPGEYRKLERVARGMKRVIARNPNEVFMIEGYTDAVGSQEDNLSLSDRRAESVAEVLTEEFQVPFENLVTQGYGEDYLKVPTQAAERLNRRVAVRRITPLLARGDEPPGRAVPPPRRDDERYDQGPDDRGPNDRGPGPGPGGPDRY
ncbi:MAG: OmpA family protein [Hyphomicrobium sp.]|uniref:OmpA family protein n=1 Tax=Hyphomicrobium sp. TaxID=82 RepID=UPI003568C5FB